MSNKSPVIVHSNVGHARLSRANCSPSAVNIGDDAGSVFDRGELGRENEGAVRLVARAMADLDMQRARERASEQEPTMWGGAKIITTNPMVQGREISVIDRRDESDDPCLVVYCRLDNWADLYEAADEPAARDTETTFLCRAGGDLRVDGNGSSRVQSRTFMAGAVVVELMHGETMLTENLVRLRIGADESGEADQQRIAEELEYALSQLTGSGVWEEGSRETSFKAWKEDAYRRYHHLGGEALSSGVDATVDALEIHKLSNGHSVIVFPGMSIRYELNTSPGERIVPAHDVEGIEAVVDILTGGGILSSNERALRGSNVQGRSTISDYYTGGSDSVFAYARPESRATRDNDNVGLVMKPEVLDRLDVRAYNGDAHGSLEEEGLTLVDRVLGRESRLLSGQNYSDRLRPDQFAELAGTHELCIGTAVALEEIAYVRLPKEDAGSFHDFEWDTILREYLDDAPRHWSENSPRYAAMVYISENWHDIAAVRTRMTEISLPEAQIDYLLTGKDLATRERLIARLKKRGVEEVAGVPIEQIIRYGE